MTTYLPSRTQPRSTVKNHSAGHLPDQPLPPSELEVFATNLGRDLVRQEATAILASNAIANTDTLISIAKAKLATNPETAQPAALIIEAYVRGQARLIERGY
ncbi:hypothetical protein [Corynebacterium cystitidis]|uniref:hypothetical protein n=1 Tax=Corynebacterium cystitidis TaxID=35757 RepID=UPI00211DDA8E|nr:hypothetical protein [Corynebacterium cystitidis]